MNSKTIAVIATTMSGSIKDWGKVQHIIPLFKKHGYDQVKLFECDSHQTARQQTLNNLQEGCRIIISAGGSGTFNACLEGCCDSDISFSEIRLGFLRKGSADLLGKVLNMPDEIEPAIAAFAESINTDSVMPCDILKVETPAQPGVKRHFVGYGGAEIFGSIPRFTENRFIKYYKGILGQLFGDLGPFGVGAALACLQKILFRPIGKGGLEWDIKIGDELVQNGRYQALIIVNGDLGPNMPLAKDVPLGSRDFYLLGLRDLGYHRLIGQFKHTWNASVKKQPEKWGYESYCINNSLTLRPYTDHEFDLNVDGSTFVCREFVTISIQDQIQLYCQ